MQAVKAEKETSTLQSGTQRVGVRWKPDVSVEAEWTPKPQAKGYVKVSV